MEKKRGKGGYLYGFCRSIDKPSLEGVISHRPQISLAIVPISRWRVISFADKHYVTTLQIDKQPSTGNLFVMDGHNNTTSLSNRMNHVVGRFRSICLSGWLENISYGKEKKKKASFIVKPLKYKPGPFHAYGV